MEVILDMEVWVEYIFYENDTKSDHLDPISGGSMEVWDEYICYEAKSDHFHRSVLIHFVLFSWDILSSVCGPI